MKELMQILRKTRTIRRTASASMSGGTRSSLRPRRQMTHPICRRTRAAPARNGDFFSSVTPSAARRLKTRHFVFAQRRLQERIKRWKKGVRRFFATPAPPAEKFSRFAGDEFNDWLAAKLDYLYPRRVPERPPNHAQQSRIAGRIRHDARSIPISRNAIRLPSARFCGVKCACFSSSAA